MSEKTAITPRDIEKKPTKGRRGQGQKDQVNDSHGTEAKGQVPTAKKEEAKVEQKPVYDREKDLLTSMLGHTEASVQFAMIKRALKLLAKEYNKDALVLAFKTTEKLHGINGFRLADGIPSNEGTTKRAFSTFLSIMDIAMRPGKPNNPPKRSSVLESFTGDYRELGTKLIRDFGI